MQKDINAHNYLENVKLETEFDDAGQHSEFVRMLWFALRCIFYVKSYINLVPILSTNAFEVFVFSLYEFTVTHIHRNDECILSSHRK